MIKFFLWAALAASVGANAQEMIPAERSSNLGPIEVFGTGVEALSRPLEPVKVDRKKVETYQYTDVNRALKNTSGVYVREEDGQGLRPNIGLRGTSPDRSKKVVMLQDGVLIGPAPYSAPAAYYTPTMNHVESLEVFKGFAGVPYGPNSVGGAVNFITPTVPFEWRNELNAAYGSFNTLNLKGSTGGPVGQNGFLLQGSRFESDGFKKLDGGGDTGFKQNHFLGKFEFALSSNLRLMLVGGYGDEDSRETYLGLSRDDFDASSYRRYSASSLDEMKWKHTALQTRLTYQISDTAVLDTNVYRHDFDRTWYRLDRFRETTVSLRGILNDPRGTNAGYLNILRGDADSSSQGPGGQLILVNNHRRYASQGIQSRWVQEFNEGFHKHALEVSARLHHDFILREHDSDRYEMTSRRMQRTTDPTQVDTRNRERALATSISVLDNWQMGSWTLTPVARFEKIDYGVRDHLAGTETTRDDSFWVPGLAVTKLWRDKYSLRTSVNEATTAAGLSSTGSEQREKAVNYEVEFKYRDPERNQETSALFFYNDYQNITGTCSVSGGCTLATDVQFNGGKALITGFELATAKGFHAGQHYFPVQASLTLLTATFESDFTSDSPEWGTNVRSGDPLPYVPRRQYLLSAGHEWGRIKHDLSIVYQSKVFDQAAVTGRQEIDAYGILDWAGEFRLTERSRLTGKIDNLLARQYAVSSRPFGYRPGKPQSFQLGWIYRF